jgi:YHS domain-containing protein
VLTFLITAAILAAPAPKPATNTHCPVLGEKINPKTGGRAVVRGQEYYLCCPGCKDKLEKNPDKYLDKDGVPLNAKPKAKK